jgi:hypothetical protein
VDLFAACADIAVTQVADTAAGDSVSSRKSSGNSFNWLKNRSPMAVRLRGAKQQNNKEKPTKRYPKWVRKGMK